MSEPDIQPFATRRKALDSKRRRKMPSAWCRSFVHACEARKGGKCLGWVIYYRPLGRPLECLGAGKSEPAVVVRLYQQKGWVLI